MRFRFGPSRRTRRDQAYDTRSGHSILQSAGNPDGRQTLHCRHRRVERRLYIRRTRHPADIIPRPRHSSTGKCCHYVLYRPRHRTIRVDLHLFDIVVVYYRISEG